MSAEQPSFNQITDQHNKGKNATILVKRSGDDGEIQTARYIGIKNEKGRYSVELNETFEGTDEKKTRWTDVEDLTDEGQARLAGELAATRAESQIVSEVLDDTLERPSLNDLGHDALAASGIERPESKAAQLDRILDKAPVLRHFESELKQIADMRKREDKEGYKQGMSQYDSSERMIDSLLKLAGQVEKPKTMSEDRRGAIYRYIDQM